MKVPLAENFAESFQVEASDNSGQFMPRHEEINDSVDRTDKSLAQAPVKLESIVLLRHMVVLFAGCFFIGLDRQAS
jgi:hypothetical protein